MLSWRSPGHPQSGGAETVTHEVLRRVVQRGHHVTWFSAGWPGAAPVDHIDGIRIVRRGRQWTVHAQAWRWLRSRIGDFDVVVDQINTLPFLTPLYVPRAKRRLYIHQTAREYWWTQTRGVFRLVAPFGYLAEPWYLRLYRTTRTVTVSQATRDELVALGFSAERVTIAPQALTFPRLETLPPAGAPGASGYRVVVVGRLEPAKHAEEGLAAFAVLQRHVPAATLDVVGAGDESYRRRLEEQVALDHLTAVTFHGRVSEERKHELMEAAHVHVFASHREGWGLTVTEAAALGTPSVGYDVPGVRDSIADPVRLAPRGDAEVLGRLLVRFAEDPVAYADARQHAWAATAELSYERTTDAYLEVFRG